MYNSKTCYTNLSSLCFSILSLICLLACIMEIFSMSAPVFVLLEVIIELIFANFFAVTDFLFTFARTNTNNLATKSH